MPFLQSRPASLMILVLLVLAAAPAAAQAPAVRRLACGGYDVVPSGYAAGRATRLSIQKKGRLLETVTDWTIASLECDDITADKVEELVVRTFSGGAHCCETVRVYALGDKPRLLLRYEANNATGVEVRDLDGDGRRELVLGDDTFAYFDDLCYACSPASLPMVACFTDGRFDDCTPRFPDLLRARRDEYLRRLRPPAGDETLKEAEGNALGALALSVLLGEEAQGLEAIRKAAPDDRVTAWLAKALPQVREWAATRSRKIRDEK